MKFYFLFALQIFLVNLVFSKNEVLRLGHKIKELRKHLNNIEDVPNKEQSKDPFDKEDDVEKNNNSDDFDTRQESDKLDSDQQLKNKLFDIFKKNQLDTSFVYEMISNTNAYLIFDCERPSYIRTKNQLVVLKNHVINDSIERKKHPAYNDTDAYICDKSERIWRINPDLFKSTGYIAFDDTRPAEADSNFITVTDEKAIRRYLKNFDSKLASTVTELAFKIVHHPDYYKVDKSKKNLIVDVFEEQEKKLPKSFRALRNEEMSQLYDKITTKSSNFSIDKQPGLKEHLFGDGYSFVVFDCENPSYVYQADKSPESIETVKIESREMKLVFQKVAYCNRNDNLWRRKSQQKTPPADNGGEQNGDSFLTYDLKLKCIGFSPASDMLKILKIKGLCDDYMRLFHHPAYYLKKFNRPFECTSKQAEQDEEKKILKIVNDHRNRKNSDSDGRKKRKGTSGDDDIFQAASDNENNFDF